MVQSGRRPPVSNLAWTEISGRVARSEDAENRPRRYNPVKTSSNTTGRPVHVCSSSGVEAATLLNRCGFSRTTSTSALWKSGSLSLW